MSRDDAGPFLMPYIAQEIYKEDPKVSIDTTGALRLSISAPTKRAR